MTELNASHQNIIGQKDKQLADFKKQVDTLQKAESELTKQIEEQKGKNNVSCGNVFHYVALKNNTQQSPSHSHPSIELNDFDYIFNFSPQYFSLRSVTNKSLNDKCQQDLRTKNWKLVEALQAAQSPPAKSANHSNFVVSAPTNGNCL